MLFINVISSFSNLVSSFSYKEDICFNRESLLISNNDNKQSLNPLNSHVLYTPKHHVKENVNFNCLDLSSSFK